MDRQPVNFDVIIAGGGPAGSLCALFLKDAGLRVALFEKDPFPRFQIGESLLPQSNPLLREAGVYDALMDAGFPAKHGAEFTSQNGDNWVHSPFENGLLEADAPAMQVDRARFDQLLLESARKRGVTVHQPVGIQRAEMEPDRAVIRTTEDEVFTARYFVQAGGRHPLSRQSFPGKQRPLDRTSRFAVYSHFTGCQRLPGKRAGNVVIVRMPRGWFWIIPLAAGHTSVGYVGEKDEWKGTTPEKLFHDRAGSSSVVGTFLKEASAVRPYTTVADYSFEEGSLGGPRFLRIGDAAGFLDPVFSSGVHLAICTARDAARIIASKQPGGTPLTKSDIHRYEKQLRQRMIPFRHLVDLFYSERGYNVMMAPRTVFGLFATVNSLVAGHSLQPFSLRWRFRIFRLIVRLNERWDFIRPSAPPFTVEESSPAEPGN